MPGNYLRVRGEYGFRAKNHYQSAGTTSACAENTQRREGSARAPTNYLRVRGEYGNTCSKYVSSWELPPRARRIRDRVGIYGHSRGTTSACAENTMGMPPHPSRGWNYLRVRGEYGNAQQMFAHHLELPPRARRIPKHKTAASGLNGTTSACAENTPWR